MLKFVNSRPYAAPEVAAKFLMELVVQHRSPHGAYADVGIVNRAFLSSGGSVAEYRAAREHALAQGWFTVHESGCRILLPN